MKSTRYLLFPYLIFTIFLFVCTKSLFGQTYFPPAPWKVDTLVVVNTPAFQYRFPERHRPVLQTLDIEKNRISLYRQRDYRILDERTIDFFSTLIIGDTLRIRYTREPIDFASKYVLFKKDTLNIKADSLKSAKEQIYLQRVKLENPFTNIQSGLQTSGSIMRGVQIGTNRDLTLNSGLNLELSGQLTDNLEVVAALTDESTPIQPEGNTQTLDEVDKVFVRFKSPYIQGTVGDFNLTYDETQFGKLSRKLQGLTLLGEYKSNYLGATVATTRGFFNRMQFIGQEGNQGPYQLTGKSDEREIIVLAGTERIWINGERVIRGESNDYIIEYGNGQVTFTNSRLITSESRIEIDFEYFPASQKYNRNVYSGTFGSSFSENRVKLNMHYYREADDPDQVFEEGGSFGDTEREILKNAGDSPLNAYTPGETELGTNKGSYIKIDTLINNSQYSYFKYVGPNEGNYNVTFSYIQNGDYTRDRLGVYRFVGLKKGTYMPRRLIPLPSSHDLIDLQAEWQPGKYYKFSTEYALTNLDQNTLSSLNDGDNQGSALKLNGGITALPLEIKKIPLGTFSLNVDGRYVEDTYQPVDRLNQPDYQRYWNILQDAQNQNEEKSLQVNSTYKPIQSMDLNLNAGYLDKASLKSQRYLGSFRYKPSQATSAAAKYEYVGSTLKQYDTKNDWWRYSAQVGREFWKFSPEILYEGEKRKNRTTDHLTGFEFDDIGGRIGLINLKFFSGSYQYNKRFDSVYDYENFGKLLPQASTSTNQVTLTLQNLRESSASLRFVRRNKDYTSKFENIKIDTLRLLYVDASVQDTVWQDRTTNLAELNAAHFQWKKSLNLTLQYRVSTEQTALKEKVYINVGEGRGNLRFDEDLQEYIPDPDGEFVLFILPSGKLEPITNLESALRVKFDPGKYWRRPTGLFQEWMSNISGESYFRVEEETKEPDIKSIYLLNLSKFQKDQTIRGNITYNQDLYILRSNRNLSFRLRYRYSDGRFNQYLDPNENEDRLSRESGLRTDWRITPKLKSQSEVRYKKLLRDSKASPLRNRDITGYYYDQNFSYRPISAWEIGLESEYGNESNKELNYPIDLWFEAVKGRIDYALPGKGRASAEYQFQKVNPTSNPLGLVVPYEMGRGKKQGNSHTWELRVEYTVAKNILFTFYYNGRNEPNFENVIHSGQAEIRAYF